MKTFHRTLAITILLFATLSISAFTNISNDEPITFDDLPKICQEWIRYNFSNQTVTRASYDAHLTNRNYEVTLSDNTTLSFDEEGRWTGAKCTEAPLCTQIIPKSIRSIVANKYPNAYIQKIHKNGMNFEVGLSTHQQLVFDSQFNVTETTEGCSTFER